MGPLQDCQLSISPVFYDTIVDLWGDVRVFVPGYEKVTRGAVKEYKIWIMIFACAATGSTTFTYSTPTYQTPTYQTATYLDIHLPRPPTTCTFTYLRHSATWTLSYLLTVLGHPTTLTFN